MSAGGVVCAQPFPAVHDRRPQGSHHAPPDALEDAARDLLSALGYFPNGGADWASSFAPR